MMPTCGDLAVRHGIVLVKNYLAKATGIKSGEAIWQAQQKCPELIVVPPNYPLYLRFSRLARSIYASSFKRHIKPGALSCHVRSASIRKANIIT
jgi:nucleotidyltransferase/DNA polymerase involved in DNA repair